MQMLKTLVLPETACDDCCSLLNSTLCFIPCQLQLETPFVHILNTSICTARMLHCCCLCRATRRWCPSSKLQPYMS